MTRIRRGTCSIENCQKPGNAGRGLCDKHYARWKKHGDPLITQRIVGDDLARFWSYVQKGEVCWLWVGATNRDGYGILRVSGRTVLAHRFSFEIEYGEIPDGKEPDHLCRVRNCVRPDHLEPVTHAENTYRGTSFSAVNYHKTHPLHQRSRVHT